MLNEWASKPGDLSVFADSLVMLSSLWAGAGQAVGEAQLRSHQSGSK